MAWHNRLEDPSERAKLEFSAGRYNVICIPASKGSEDSRLEIKIDPETERRLSESSAILSIEDMTGNVQSNRVLITNLLDVDTGASVRKARYVKEAEQNAAGLLAALYDLRSANDEDALRTFPYLLRHSFDIWYSTKPSTIRKGRRSTARGNEKSRAI